MLERQNSAAARLRNMEGDNLLARYRKAQNFTLKHLADLIAAHEDISLEALIVEYGKEVPE